MHRSILLLVTGLLTGPSLVRGQAGPVIQIPTRPTDTDYYPWITQLSIGEVRWSQNARDSVLGRRYRAAVLTSEIFSTLVIELITSGTEGCCMRVAWSRRVDMDAFRRAFKLGAELSGLVVGSWRSDRSFEFTIQRRRFLASIGDGPTLTIQEL